MKYIAKGPEPIELSNWKAQTTENWQPLWDILRSVEKDAVKRALLEEQGCLCAYCCQQVERQTSHIDHVEPQKARPDLALDYGNMVASCPGEPEEGEDYPAEGHRPPELIHCGHAKGEWHDPARFVDPRSPDCEKAFTFTAGGRIRVASGAPAPDAAQETIKRLNLDCAPLKRQRQAAIGAELDRLAQMLTARGALTYANVTARITRLQQRDATGRFAPFAPAIIDILEQRASTLP